MIRIKFLKDIVKWDSDTVNIKTLAYAGTFGWILDLNPDYCNAYADGNRDHEFQIVHNEYEIANDPTFTGTVTYPSVSDEMVEQAAKAMKQYHVRHFNWSDEKFEDMWNDKSRFNDREEFLEMVRKGLETVLQIPY
jgi:hypothetical protein